MKPSNFVFTGYFWFKGTLCGVASLLTSTPEATGQLVTVSLLSYAVMGLMYLVESSPDTW